MSEVRVPLNLPYLDSRMFEFQGKQYYEVTFLFGTASVKCSFKGDIKELEQLKYLQKVNAQFLINVKEGRFTLNCVKIAP